MGFRIGAYCSRALFIWLGLWAGSNLTMATPFEGIVRRNVFGLAAPPKLVEPPRLLPRITLVGIATVLERKVAILNIDTLEAAASAKRSIVLKEGDTNGDIRLVSIDEEHHCVTISADGRFSVDTFSLTFR